MLIKSIPWNVRKNQVFEQVFGIVELKKLADGEISRVTLAVSLEVYNNFCRSLFISA